MLSWKCHVPSPDASVSTCIFPPAPSSSSSAEESRVSMISSQEILSLFFRRITTWSFLICTYHTKTLALDVHASAIPAVQLHYIEHTVMCYVKRCHKLHITQLVLIIVCSVHMYGQYMQGYITLKSHLSTMANPGSFLSVYRKCSSTTCPFLSFPPRSKWSFTSRYLNQLI